MIQIQHYYTSANSKQRQKCTGYVCSYKNNKTCPLFAFYRHNILTSICSLNCQSNKPNYKFPFELYELNISKDKNTFSLKFPVKTKVAL